MPGTRPSVASPAQYQYIENVAVSALAVPDKATTMMETKNKFFIGLPQTLLVAILESNLFTNDATFRLPVLIYELCRLREQSLARTKLFRS